MTGENKKKCDLCALPVEVDGFSLNTAVGKKCFCCEGCKGIYQMLNEELLLPEAVKTLKITES